MSRLQDFAGLTYLAPALLAAAIFSFFINVLALAGPLFMLEIYDRVIPARSVPTLVALAALVIGIYTASGFLEIIRGRVMSRIGALVDATISRQVVAVIAGASLRTRVAGDVLKPAQEAEQIRSFISSSGPSALFDLPWLPFYLALCFFLNPLIGWLASGTMGMLLFLTLATDFLTRTQTRKISEAVATRNRFGEAIHRNAEAVAAMGMIPKVTAQWEEAQIRVSRLHRTTGDIAGVFIGFSRSVRQVAQSGTLAVGAWLVIQGDMTGGSIIAASVIVARALQPIEQLIANWRSMLAARRAWLALNSIFQLFPPESKRLVLPSPSRTLTVDGLFTGPPSEPQRMTVQNVSFQVESGTVVGVIGPSASGKSSLVRALAGVWPAHRGRVSLDGASLDQWRTSALGAHIGYMPQSSDLFPGTIADNIARLDRKAPHNDVVAAAKAAGVHDMIVSLQYGYETQVGEGGMNLSAGQRQRIALARALYRAPFLVILDEPNSNLDAEGDKALSSAVSSIKDRGGIAIIVAHRNSILAQLDMLLLMENGVAKAFGPREAVLNTLQQQNQRQPTTRHTVPPALTVIDREVR